MLTQEREADNLTSCHTCKNKLLVFRVSVQLLAVHFVLTLAFLSSSLGFHSALASWIHGYFDHIMYVVRKFMINNRTVA